MKVSISVIVPVYNAEGKVEKLLDSLVNQTFDDFEVIMVDDGSDDCSGDICLDYQRKFEKFHYYRQENQGAATARRYGFEHSNGEFIYFCDSDDIVDSECLNLLYSQAQTTKADIVIGEYRTLDSRGDILRGEVRNRYNKPVISRDEYPVIESENTIVYCNTFLWTRLFRKAIITSQDFISEKKVAMEDVLFILYVTNRASVIAFVDHVVYSYIQHASSLTHSYDSKIQLQKIEAYLSARIEFLQDIGKFSSTNEAKLLELYLALVRECINKTLKEHDIKQYRLLMREIRRSPHYLIAEEQKKKLDKKNQICVAIIKYKLDFAYYIARKVLG